MRLGAQINPWKLTFGKNNLFTQLTSQLESSLLDLEQKLESAPEDFNSMNGLYGGMVLGNNWIATLLIPKKEASKKFLVTSFNASIYSELNETLDIRKTIAQFSNFNMPLIFFPWSSNLEDELRLYSRIPQNAELPNYSTYFQLSRKFPVLLYPNQNQAQIETISQFPEFETPFINLPIRRAFEDDNLAKVVMSYGLCKEKSYTLLPDWFGWNITGTPFETLNITWLCYNTKNRLISVSNEEINTSDFPNHRTGRKELLNYAKNLAVQVSENYNIPVQVYQLPIKT